MSRKENIRPSVLAGRWYPADPEQLAHSVDSYLQEPELPELSGKLIGVVSPHAGHPYSGPVAGYAFSALAREHPEIVVVLSPLHRPAEGALLTTAHRAYQTPLGVIEVADELLEQVSQGLKEQTGSGLTRIVHDSEHAVEILLPFLQRSLRNPFRLLPIMLRQQDPDLARTLAAVLTESLIGKDAILIASTDLSHFYSAPEAEELDRSIIERIIDLDPEGIYRLEEQGKGYACGKGGLAAVIWAAKNLGANQAVHLKYSHSGEITGDTSRVVGYEAAALLQK